MDKSNNEISLNYKVRKNINDNRVELIKSKNICNSSEIISYQIELRSNKRKKIINNRKNEFYQNFKIDDKMLIEIKNIINNDLRFLRLSNDLVNIIKSFDFNKDKVKILFDNKTIKTIFITIQNIINNFDSCRLIDQISQEFNILLTEYKISVVIF